MPPSLSSHDCWVRSHISLISLLFVWTVILLGPPVSGQNIEQGDVATDKSCSFQSQGCTYNIYLARKGGENNEENLRQTVQRVGNTNCGRDSGRVLLDDQAQKDYSAKLDSMEKSFSFVKDAHESRLKELEGTIQTLIGSSIAKPGSPKIARSISKVEEFTSGNEEFVRRLEIEFEKLRQDLREKTTDLLDAKEKINETNRRMHEEQVQRFETSRKLLDAENRIIVLRRERAVLKNQLKDRSYKLEITSAKVKSCEENSVQQMDRIDRLTRESSNLLEEKQAALLLLNNSKAEFNVLTTKHKALKARLARARRVVEDREKELIGCYRAKANTFCDFENPKICGFTNVNKGDLDIFDWQRARGRTPSQRTGPSKDHTCDSDEGHFMYIESSSRLKGHNAILNSPTYFGFTQQCVEFFYHMYGFETGTLNVYTKAHECNNTLAWSKNGDKGNTWLKARLNIPKNLARARYQIVFEAVTVAGYYGDIAIDDVSVTEGPCAVDGSVKPVQVVVDLPTTQHIAEKLERKHRRRQKRQWRRKVKPSDA